MQPIEVAFCFKYPWCSSLLRVNIFLKRLTPSAPRIMSPVYWVVFARPKNTVHSAPRRPALKGIAKTANESK